MKANKALKRLTKIEALVADVTRRISASAPHVSDVLDDLKAAVDRVKDAVSAHVSSSTAKKKAKPAPKKKTPKKKAAKTAKAKAPKKTAPVKRTAKKPAAKRTAAAAAQSAQAAPRESTPATAAAAKSGLQ